jgi:ParB family chromosome partitioning protein
MHTAELARITGKSELTLNRYITLMQKGEERLICGIEAGLISFNFAMKVIECTESETQSFLLNEFLNGNITMRDVDSITKLLNERAAKGQSNKGMKMPKLKAIIKKKTEEHKLFYEQHKVKRDDAIYLNASLTALWNDEKFCEMILAIKELPKPTLQGQYGNREESTT